MEPCAPVTGAVPINYCRKSEASITLLCQLFSTHYTPIRIKTWSKSTSVIKVAIMKNTDDFHYACEGSHHVQQPNRHFLLSAKMKKHKGGYWLQECIGCTAICQKAHFGLKRHQTVKKKACSGSRYRVMLVWRHQLSSQEKILLSKFRSNFSKEFQVNLKACLGLVLSNQYCPIVGWENWGWFLGCLIQWATPTPWMSLLCTTIVIHDKTVI